MRPPESRILGRHGIGLRDFAKERLHLARGVESNQDAAGASAGPHVGNPARSQQRIPSAKREPFHANFKDEFAILHLEPLILIVVEVTRWSALLTESVLDDQQALAV